MFITKETAFKRLLDIDLVVILFVSLVPAARKLRSLHSAGALQLCQHTRNTLLQQNMEGVKYS
jgi:hypothetical protein